MEDWFDIERIDDDTYVISEYKHWEEPHCYLLCGTNRSVLIDTGLGVKSIRAEVEKITSSPIVVLTTHAHWDHIGSHEYFENIAIHELEKGWLETQFPLPLQVVKNNLILKSCDFPPSFHLDDYHIFKGKISEILHDDDIIDLGNRQLRVIHTPGHSPGHCCFYESDRGLLYSGDLVYCGCLDAFYPTTNPEHFLQSIRKVQELRVNRILPAHHKLNIPNDIIDRIGNAFCQLDRTGNLKHGSGTFDFDDFQIHV